MKLSQPEEGGAVAKYHIQITAFDSEEIIPKADASKDFVDKFVASYHQLGRVMLNGRSVPRDEIRLIKIIRVDSDGSWEDVTDDLLTLAPTSAPSASQQPIDKPDPRFIWVVYGRNELARRAMFRFLRALDLHPIEWEEAVGRASQATPDNDAIVEAGFSMAQGVVILKTPDDEARLRQGYRKRNEPADEKRLTAQARQNVIYEAGIARAKHTYERTVIVELGVTRSVSDQAGLNVVRMDDTMAKRQALAHRLLQAGCAVNMTGVDWHTEGEFDAAIKPADSEKAVRVQSKSSSKSSIPQADREKIAELRQHAGHYLLLAKGNPIFYHEERSADLGAIGNLLGFLNHYALLRAAIRDFLEVAQGFNPLAAQAEDAVQIAQLDEKYEELLKACSVLLEGE
jgi:predicted nucleotide-binding protein